MDTLEAIHTRRSVRKYTEDPISEEQTREILAAGMTAPSAGNAQPWQFVVVDDPAVLKKVPDLNPYAPMASKAPLGILVCGDLSLEKYPGFWVQDCSAAIQNMLLAARALGLGGVWTGIHPVEQRTESFTKLFNLPDTVIPLGFLVFGHPLVEQKRSDRFREDRIHRNTW